MRTSSNTFSIHNIHTHIHSKQLLISPHSLALSECTTIILGELERTPSVEIIKEIIDLEDTERPFNELIRHNTERTITNVQPLNARSEDFVKNNFDSQNK